MPAMAAAKSTAPKRIRDVFYETRVLMGREYTIRRFAEEVLGGSIDPVMLGYIEKGKRFPSEALVRRLAATRKQDPQELLALLWRDRTLHAFGKELRRILAAPRSLTDIHDADLAVLISQAIAALPDDGAWITLSKWRAGFRAVKGQRRVDERASADLIARVEQALRDRELIEIKGDKVRRRGRHFVAKSTDERQALALEFCALFAKGLIDKLALPEKDTGTYVRDHYFHIAPERMGEFHRRLDEVLRALAEEFADDPVARNRFMNVLVTATPYDSVE
jgi:hypothetical protein